MAIEMDAIYKLPTSKKVAILVVLICVVIGLYAYAFFIPQQNELSTLKGELNNLARELNESKAIEKEFETYKKQVEQLNIELMNALTQLPNEKPCDLCTALTQLGHGATSNPVASAPRMPPTQ